MKSVQLAESRLSELLEHFPSRRIAVVGDFFLDKYLDVDPKLEEPSVETGKPAHQVVDVRCAPGAAGTVVSNLAALGAGEIHAIGFRGNDGEGYDLAKALEQLGCSTKHLHVDAERHTPTYLKPRDNDRQSLDAEHSRYDTKNHTPTSETTQQKIIESLQKLSNQVDAVIAMDQVEQSNCGVIPGTVRAALSKQARQFRSRVVFWADSRRHIHHFHHLTIKPNQFETVGLENPAPDAEIQFDELMDAAKKLRSKNEAPIVVTRGAKGMLVSDPDWTLVPGVRVDGPTDPTGAGDSATAGTVLSLCAGGNLAESALVGNLIASITIQQINTTGVAKPQQLPDRLAAWQSQQ